MVVNRMGLDRGGSSPEWYWPFCGGFCRERICQFVILTNRLAAVFAFKAANREMAFREALKVVAEHDVERETADCAGDGDELRGHFLTYLKAKSGSDLAQEGNKGRCALFCHSFLGDIGDGFPRYLRQCRPGCVVRAFFGVSMRVFGAEGEDLQASQAGFRVQEVLPLTAGYLNNGVQHDGGGDGKLDEQTGQPKEAADRTGNGGSGGVGALVDCGGRFCFVSLECDTQTLLEGFIDGHFYGRLGGAGESVQQRLDRHAKLGGNFHDETLGFEFCDGGLEISVIGRREVAHASRVIGTIVWSFSRGAWVVGGDFEQPTWRTFQREKAIRGTRG